MKRTLSLKREPLAELTVDQLTSIVGGYALPTTPVKECYADATYTLQATRCFCP